jgi:glutathione peroxidase
MTRRLRYGKSMAVDCWKSGHASVRLETMSTLFEVPVTTLSGEPTTLAPYKGHVLLIVNTASKCGLTPQYEGLEKLYNTYKDRGFEVLGFPANDFAGQEPGTNEEIAKFCTTSFDVTFPMFSKIAVTGPEKSPLYELLIAAQPEALINDPDLRANLNGFLSKSGGKTNDAPELLWNFEKFLVNREGQVVARFAPDTPPSGPAIVEAIEREL